jgi:hypothetical protein
MFQNMKLFLAKFHICCNMIAAFLAVRGLYVWEKQPGEQVISESWRTVGVLRRPKLKNGMSLALVFESSPRSGGAHGPEQRKPP